MNLCNAFNELWIYLNILIQVFTIDLSADDTEKTTSPVRLLGEWPISGDNNQWIASLNCPIYLAENYTPEDDEMGFHIYLTLEDQATNVESVFHPFDRNSIVMEEEDGKKQFLITTSTGIWEYKGQKNYEIHVVFTNKMKNKKGHWPRGTCSGPYALDEVNVRQKTCRSPTLQGESCPGEYSHSLFTTLSDSHKTTTSQVRIRSEWPISGESNHWIASIMCSIDLAENYTPEDNQKGLSIYLVLEEHATNINSVFHPFDRNSIIMEEVDGMKQFLITTSTGIWEYKGQKNYEIHVAFRNQNKHEKGNWPRGTCSGPYALKK